MEAGEYSGAADALRQAIADGESTELVWRELAANTAAAGDGKRAVADLHLALRTFPNSFSLQNVLAQVHVAGPAASAETLAKAIAPEGPALLRERYAAGSRLNGLSEWLGRQNPEASGFATREAWAHQEPDNAQVQRLWGEALRRSRRSAEAGPVLIYALSLAPSSPAANLAYASVLEEQHQYPQAMTAYLNCLKLRPDWLPALLGMGHAAISIDLPKYGVPAYKRATEIAPTLAEAWIGLGRASSLEPDLIGSSVVAFQKVRQLAPARTDYATDYAAAVIKAGQADAGPTSPTADALSLLRSRVAAVPGDSLTHYLLGTMLMRGAATATSQAEAEMQTRKALELSPDNPLSEIQLGRILLGKNDVPGAVALLTRALAATPDNVPALRTLAQAYARSGQPVLSAHISAQALALTAVNTQIKVLRDRERANQLDAAVHEQLAALYHQKGSEREAQTERSMAALIRKDPQAASAQFTAVNSLVEGVLKPH